MNTKLFISVVCIFATGVCQAQAPVVDAQDTPPPQSVSSLPPAITSSVGVGLTSVALEQRLATMERIIDSRSESQQRMQMQVDDLRNDIDDMRGSIELHNHQLEKMLERQRELFLELDRRFAGMQQSSTDISNNIASGGGSNIVQAANAVDEQAMYQNAVNLILKDKDYVKAVPAFQAFLVQYPNTGLTANAHYWLGQLLYNQQEYTKATEQFSQVANKFSDSPKRSDSLLKLGLIEIATGNVSAANRLFQQVVNEYPNSTPARLASQQLAN
jgi:tol-pal system protein YbgF